MRLVRNYSLATLVTILTGIVTVHSQDIRLIQPLKHVYVESVAFSPDGKLVLTGGFDKSAKLWNAETGKLLVSFQPHKMYLEKTNFSPDGKRIVSAGDAGLHVWSSATGELLHKFNASGDFDFTPDSKKIASYNWNDSVKIWDLVTGKEQRLMQFVKDANYNSIRFSRSGKLLAASTADSSTIIWSVASGKMLRVLKSHKGYVTASLFSPDENFLVSLSKDSTAKLWEIRTGRLLKTLKGHQSEITEAKFSPDGTKLLTIDNDWLAIIWDLPSGSRSKTFKPGKKISGSAVFSPDGKYIWSIGENNTAYRLRSSDGSIDTVFKGHSDYLTCISLSADGKKLVTGSSDHTAIVWDAATADLLTTLTGSTSSLIGSRYSADGKLILSNSNSGVRIWDAATLRLKRTIDGEWAGFNYPMWSEDGEHFITRSDSTNQIKVWNVGEYQPKSVLSHDTSINYAAFSRDASKVISVQSDSTLIAWNVADAEMNWTIRSSHLTPGRAISPNSKSVVLINNGLAIVVGLDSGDVISEMEVRGKNIVTAVFSPNGKHILTASSDGIGRVWDAATGVLVYELRGHKNRIQSAFYSNDGRFIATVCQTHLMSEEVTIRIWRSVDGSLQSVIKINPNLEFKRTAFSADGNSIVGVTGLPLNEVEHINTWSVTTGDLVSKIVHPKGYLLNDVNISGQSFLASENTELALFDLKKNSKTLSVFAIDNEDYLVTLPDMYYMSSPGAAKKLHYVTKDLQVISFEQLDVKYNRPDIVLTRLGSTDSLRIRSMQNAYQKRVSKLGIDSTAFKAGFELPTAIITNRQSISYEQKSGKLTLHISGRSKASPLTHFNIWINENPLFGLKGITLGSSRYKFDTTVTIHLSNGKNIIETSVRNENGTESYRMPLMVKHSVTNAAKEKIHFIGIGINRFEQPGHDLNWSVKDIRDLAISLKKIYGNDLLIDTLFDTDVTIANVLALKTKLLQTNVNDKVIVSYSGHGLLSEDFDYYLSTYNVNFGKPEENGLSYETLESLMDGIPARQKLMLIDACHSGEVDKEEMEKYVMLEKTLEDSGTKSSRKPVPKDGRMGMQNSFELMRELFVNVGRTTGATVISAAAGTQFAQEKSDLQNGVFTYSILEYMQLHPTATVTELRNYVNKRVPELTQGMQVPTARSETKAVDWRVW